MTEWLTLLLPVDTVHGENWRKIRRSHDDTNIIKGLTYIQGRLCINYALFIISHSQIAQDITWQFH